MASATVGVRFVRCPKCDKLLTEFHQVPVYRCGGCGTVLRAKVRASTAETTVGGSVERDSQSPAAERRSSGGSSFVNRSASPANQADTSLDHRRVLNSNPACDSDGIAENLPERGNQVSLEEDSYRVGNDAGSLEDDIRFTYLAYDDASDSSRDEQPLSRRRFGREKASGKDGTQPPQTQGIPAGFPNEVRSLERDTTFGSDDFHSVRNWMGSEIGDDELVALSKDLLFRGGSPRKSSGTRAGRSEPEHLKILRKVDELRDELREFLMPGKTSQGKRGPRCSRRDAAPPRAPEAPTRSCGERGGAKEHAARRYFRPVCGGAPFVVCYKCWELLQLPADFLVSGRALHRLRCGACSEVLVFSFRPRSPADPPRTPAEAQHPPSEVDSGRGGPGGSTSDEPARDASSSSSYSTKRRNWQRANASRLHLLMGYSSASDILFEGDGRRRADGGGNSSSGASTPQFYRPPPPPPGDGRRRRRYGEHGGAGAGTSKSPEVQEAAAAEEPSSRERAAGPRRRGSAALGLLKKGVRELSHGLENVKLKVHSRG